MSSEPEQPEMPGEFVIAEEAGVRVLWVVGSSMQAFVGRTRVLRGSDNPSP